MSEATLLELFRNCWLEIVRQFWPEPPHQRLKVEFASLGAELARRQSCLLLTRKRIEKLHDRLKRREHRLALLAASAQEMPTAAGAIDEQERDRRGIARIRERLQNLEYRYARRLGRLRQRKHRWTELRERLLSGSLPKRIDRESDPDYPF